LAKPRWKRAARLGRNGCLPEDDQCRAARQAVAAGGQHLLAAEIIPDITGLAHQPPSRLRVQSWCFTMHWLRGMNAISITTSSSDGWLAMTMLPPLAANRPALGFQPQQPDPLQRGEIAPEGRANDALRTVAWIAGQQSEPGQDDDCQHAPAHEDECEGSPVATTRQAQSIRSSIARPLPRHAWSDEGKGRPVRPGQEVAKRPRHINLRIVVMPYGRRRRQRHRLPGPVAPNARASAMASPPRFQTAERFG